VQPGGILWESAEEFTRIHKVLNLLEAALSVDVGQTTIKSSYLGATVQITAEHGQ